MKCEPLSRPVRIFIQILCGLFTCIALAFAVAAVGGSKAPSGANYPLALFALVAGVIGAIVTVRLSPAEGRKSARLTLIMLSAIAMVLSAIAVPLIQSARFSVAIIQCRENVKSLTLNLIMYTADHDDHLPPSDRWRTALRGVEEQGRCSRSTSPWTYAFNSAVGGKSISKVNPDTALVFEAEAYVPDASGGETWFAPRHSGVGYYGTVSGELRSSLYNKPSILWEP